MLTPSLNKSFKFKSKWPYNNSQSYLLQSVINDMKNDSKLSMKKQDGNYVFKSKVNYKNNASLTHQIVTIDKNLNIKKVVVYDNTGSAQIKVSFKSCDMKAKFNNKYFVLEENMKTFDADTESDDEKTTEESKMLDEAVYPMYLPDGTYLESEKTIDLDEGSRIIMTFSGDTPFMLVEETVSKSDDMEVIPTNGDLDILGGNIAIIGDSSVSFINDGLQYYLVSSDMSKEDLITVAKSVAPLPVGK